MRAIIHEAYGAAHDVLTLREVQKPVPGDSEVLIRVKAASMHADVWHVVEGVPYVIRLGNGVRRPKRPIPGTDLAGIVEATGANVKRLRCGDAVFGEIVKFGWLNGGAYAEYAVVPEEFLVLKPDNITFEQAAAVPAAGIIALSNIRLGNKAGQKAVINGAGGATGMLAIQILKAQGAHVTAIDSAGRLPLMTAAGADRVVDYAKEDYLCGTERYDFVLDIAAVLRPTEYKHVLTSTGQYVPIGHAHYGHASRFNGRVFGSLPYFIGLLLRTLLDPRKRKAFKILSKLQLMTELKTLLESGKLTPVVAKTYPLEDVAQAMRDMQAGKTLGRMIITP